MEAVDQRIPEHGRRLGELLPVGRERAVCVAVAAALVVAAFAVEGMHAKAAVGLVLFPALVALTSIDLRHHLLPNLIVMPAALGVGLVVAATEPHIFVSHLLAGVALGGFLFLFAAIFAGGLGMGDAKLGLLMGLALGSATMPAMLYALLGVFVAALWILFRQGAASRKQMIAFGPYLAAGTVLAYFLG